MTGLIQLKEMTEQFGLRRTSPEEFRAGMSDFLRCFEWSHFATLTMGDAQWEASAASARRYFEQCWIRVLEKASQKRVRWFWALEGGTTTTRRHIHALLGGCERLSPEWMSEPWPWGHSEISVCGRSSKAIDYVLKSIGTASDDYDIYWSNPKARSARLRKTVLANHRSTRNTA